MTTGALGGKAVVALDVVQARAAVSVVTPKAGLTYELPVAQLDYIVLKSSTFLDTSGLYKLVREAFVVADDVAYDLAKSSADTVSTVDAATVAAAKGITDSIGLFEFVVIQLVFLRDFADSVGAQDAFVSLLAKLVADTVSASDASTRTAQKGLADSVLMYEDFAKAFTKPLSDSATAAEQISLAPEKNIADSQGLTDSQVFGVDKLLNDPVSFVEALVFDVTRLITDGVAMSDGADVTDGLIYSFSNTTANVVLATDSTVAGVTKALSDAQPVADAGSLLSQGYAEMGYFAEDYVGDARIF
jgi:hypothetical protein